MRAGAPDVDSREATFEAQQDAEAQAAAEAAQRREDKQTADSAKLIDPPPSWALLKFLRDLQLQLKAAKQAGQRDLTVDARRAAWRHRQTTLLVIGSPLIWARHCAFCILVMGSLYVERCDVYMCGFGMRQPSGLSSFSGAQVPQR